MELYTELKFMLRKIWSNFRLYFRKLKTTSPQTEMTLLHMLREHRTLHSLMFTSMLTLSDLDISRALSQIGYSQAASSQASPDLTNCLMLLERDLNFKLLASCAEQSLISKCVMPSWRSPLEKESCSIYQRAKTPIDYHVFF